MDLFAPFERDEMFYCRECGDYCTREEFSEYSIRHRYRRCRKHRNAHVRKLRHDDLAYRLFTCACQSERTAGVASADIEITRADVQLALIAFQHRSCISEKSDEPLSVRRLDLDRPMSRTNIAVVTKDECWRLARSNRSITGDAARRAHDALAWMALVPPSD